MRSDKVRHDDTSRYVMMIRHDATGLCLRVVRHDAYHDVQLVGLCLRDACKLWNGGVCGSLVYTRCNASVAVVLQHVVAVRYSVLQCVAVCCDVLRLMCVTKVMGFFGPLPLLRQLCCGGVAVVLQCVAVCYDVLQLTCAF